MLPNDFHVRFRFRSNGCWEWISKNKFGYGSSVRIAGIKIPPHVVSYRHFLGPYPIGFDLDHLCRNRSCINPEHLEPVTRAVNNSRRVFIKKTHCKHGHEWDPANTRFNQTPKGGYQRTCRKCAVIVTARYRKNQKEK